MLDFRGDPSYCVFQYMDLDSVSSSITHVRILTLSGWSPFDVCFSGYTKLKCTLVLIVSVFLFHMKILFLNYLLQAAIGPTLSTRPSTFLFHELKELWWIDNSLDKYDIYAQLSFLKLCPSLEKLFITVSVFLTHFSWLTSSLTTLITDPDHNAVCPANEIFRLILEAMAHQAEVNAK